LGLAALGSKKLAIGAAAGLLVVATGALFLLLLPAYPRPTIYQPGQELTRTCIRFDESLQVEAVETDNSVRPGETLPVTIYGYGLVDAAQPQTVALRLLGSGGQEVGRAITELHWQKGNVVSATAELPVVQDAVPARAVLDAAMLDEAGQNQAATSATSRVLEVPVPLQTLKIAPSSVYSPDPQVTTAASFGDQLALIGYDVQGEGDGLIVTLYWQVLEEMDQDYTTFVHVLNGDGQLVAQSDSQPTNGVYPTSIWDKGEIVADRKELTLPPEAPTHNLQIAAGVYLLETMQRLPARDADGQRQPGDQVLLDLIRP
ncbi:MAG: hypothetical protein ACK2UK_01500, partial [Candidatus Promineifilaceae bacterium]